MEQKLSQEAVDAVKKATEQQQKLNVAGMEPATETQKVYENFVEIGGLPSKGLFYKNAIKGQALKVEDLLQIQNVTEENVHQRFNEIFSRRIRGIEPHEILYGDEVYIALWLRESSYPGYAFPHSGFTCKKCGLDVPEDAAEFGFESLSFKTNAEEILKAYSGTGFVEFTLPNGTKCKIFLKQRSHISRVQTVLHRDYYQYNRKPPEGRDELLELLSVVDIGIPDLAEAANEFMKFDAIDFTEFINNVQKNTLNTDIIVNLTCPDPECKEVTPMMGYPFRPEIYFPINTRR